MANNPNMRAMIIGGAIIAVALTVLAYVAIYPYMSRGRLPPLATDTVADRSLPPVRTEPDRQNPARSMPRVLAEAGTQTAMKAPDPVARAVDASLSRCGPELWAEDLAGECRAKPCPTMGALEVSGASAQKDAKPICRADTIKSRIHTSNTPTKKQIGRAHV